MVSYYIVTDVLDCITLCLPEDVFDEHFTVVDDDDGCCRHKWYHTMFSGQVLDDYLEAMWDKLLDTYSMQNKESLISFGNFPSGTKILNIYRSLT